MLSTGEIIDGKYRVIRLIGEGGMGAVYEAENVRIHRRVAIKVLHAGVAETGEAVQRFEREAQAAGRIGSEHIVEVLDLGNLASGDRYLVMEFMDGDSLNGRIKARGRLNPPDVYPIAYQLLSALQAAHSAGIIHRDLKPDNVFLLRSRGGQADFVKLLDFGISKFSQLSGDSGFSMTRTGAVMGTPYYMAPEQAKGAKELDHRVDLYAAGVILYEALTGEVPFNADTFNELLFKIVLEQPRPVEQLRPDIDPGFAGIVNKAMAREPSARFQSAQEFQQALQLWASNSGAELANALRSPIRQSIADGTGGYAAQPVPTPPATSLGTATHGTFANTSGIPKQSNAGLFVVLGVVGLLVVGGGFVGFRMLSSSRSAAAEQTAAEERSKVEARAAASKAEAERSAAAEQAKAMDAVKPAPTHEPAPEPAPSAAPVVAPAKPKAVAAAPKPAAPAAKPAAPTPAPASTGRKIRTSL